MVLSPSDADSSSPQTTKILSPHWESTVYGWFRTAKKNHTLRGWRWVKNSLSCSGKSPGLELGRTDLIDGESNGTPLQYSCLENPIDGRAWWAAVCGVAQSRTWLSGFTFTFHFHALEKEMATHSSVLAWRIPGTGEPGGLPSMGSHRVRHD